MKSVAPVTGGRQGAGPAAPLAAASVAGRGAIGIAASVPTPARGDMSCANGATRPVEGGLPMARR